MNNGNGPNSNSGHDGAPGPFKNGVFADGLPPGLDELPPGLMAMLEAMSEEPPAEDDDESPPEAEEDSEGEGETEDETEDEGQQEFAFKGTPDDDTFTGTDTDERIKGGPGNDNLAGGGGDDDLEGGPGDDFLGGGDGSDELKGGPGDDQLSGGAGNDVLIAGPGNDHLMGGDGDDVYVFGGSLEPIPEEEPEEEPPEDEEDPPAEDDPSEESDPPEDGDPPEEGGELAASAEAKSDNPGKGNGNAGGNGKGNGNGNAAGKDDDEDEDDELLISGSDSEEPSESSEDESEEDEPEEEEEGEEEDDEDDESGDGETGLAWGDNVIEDSSGNETVRFDGEARSVLQHEQDGSDLILSAGNGSLRITGYYDDPGRWTFEDDLGTFDPTDDGGEPPAEDPGDTPETASAIESGFETSGDVGFEDDAADVFALTAPGDGDVVISLTGLSGTAHLRLLDGEGNVQAEASAMDGSESLVVPVTGGTQHFLEVTDGGESGAEYGLAVDFTPDWGNTLETATPVESLDGWALTATVGFGDDTGDFAQLTPDADGTLVLEVDGGDTDPSLTLLSASGDILAAGVPNGFGENRLEFELTGGETYVVAIEPDGAPATYVAGSAYSVTPEDGEAPAVVDAESFSS